jgi:hypothetical protein
MGISDFRALAEPADLTVLSITVIFYPQSVKRQKQPYFTAGNNTIACE